MCEFANVRMCELNSQFAHPHIRTFAHSHIRTLTSGSHNKKNFACYLHLELALCILKQKSISETNQTNIHA
jgi:hypothetical protein